MSTGPVVRKDLRDAIQAELRALIAGGETQTSIGQKIGMEQVTVGKAANLGKLGQDVANAFLDAYGLDPEELIAKHGTRVTAWDVIELLGKCEGLVAAVKADSGRWSAERLLAVLAEVKAHPNLADPRLEPTRGNWRDILDGAKGTRVGGKDRFREHRKGPRP
ncbi:MAG TPA: hypothetical protein VNJ04_04975 [Gemmatimonadaceae bacterium]|nr:hypothetical protein [Gemmatimonadaceae bacterium]